MSIKGIFGASVLILGFCSCIQEYTPYEDNERAKLVIKAEIESGSVAPLIEISSSFRQSDSIPVISNAIRVEMYEENNPEPYEFSLLQESGTHWQAPEDLIFEQGKAYFLKIDPTDIDIQAANGESVIPFPGELHTISYNLDENIDELALSMKLNEPPHYNSYYHLIPFYLDEYGEKQYLDLDRIEQGSNACILLNNRYGMLIDYFSLPEDKYLSFVADYLHSANTGSQNSGFLYIILRTVDEDYYLYNRSLSKLTESNQNPFTLPTTTFSNISNGYGLFSAFSSVTDSIRIE